jgi:hypothetical protein
VSDSEDRNEKQERWLPPRLRDKLDDAADDDDDDAPQKSSPAGLIIGILVVIGVLAGGWFMFQNYQAQQAEEAERIAAEQAAREQAVADSLAAIAMADSLAEVARADSIEAFNKLPRREQRRIIAAQQAAEKAAGGGATSGSASSAGSGGGSAAAEPPPPVETGPFALDAGQYIFEEPAQAAAEQLRTATGLEAVVAPVGSGDNQTFHVYLGKFSGRAAAEKSANELISAGTVSQARVVKAPN